MLISTDHSDPPDEFVTTIELADVVGGFA